MSVIHYIPHFVIEKEEERNDTLSFKRTRTYSNYSAVSLEEKEKQSKMEANGLSKSSLPSFCLTCGTIEDIDMLDTKMMTMLNNDGNNSTTATATATAAATTTTTTTIAGASLMIPTPTTTTTADISPTCSRECNSSDTTNPRKRNSSNISSSLSSSSSSSFIRCPNCCIAKYCSNQCLQKGCCSTNTTTTTTTSTTTDKAKNEDTAAAAAAAAVVDTSCSSVCEVVTKSRRKVREIEKQIRLNLTTTTTTASTSTNTPQQQQQQQQQIRLQEQLLMEKVHLIDSLVLMAWHYYQYYLNTLSSSFDKAEAAVRYIYEEALDHSIEVFCMKPSPTQGTTTEQATGHANTNNATNTMNMNISTSITSPHKDHRRGIVSENYIKINNERLMILLLVLDFDEYCETLLEYQLTREYILTQSNNNAGSNVVNTGTVDDNSNHNNNVDAPPHLLNAVAAAAAAAVPNNNNNNMMGQPPHNPLFDLRDVTNTTMIPRGGDTNTLQQMYNLWKSGRFERFDPIADEQEEHFAKIHAAGLCLVLFRKLEQPSQQLQQQQQQQQQQDNNDQHQHQPPPPQQQQNHPEAAQAQEQAQQQPTLQQTTTNLSLMERQFRYLFDEYLPRQLTQPSMNNIIATKYAHVLFHENTPTVYWSLLADSYRKEWGQCFDSDGDTSSTDDMDDEDDDDDEDDGR
jgi:hypothetical protein